MTPSERANAPVHVVLLNYNGWGHTIECLESLLRSDYDDTRIVVVDNGSTDGSVERIQAWASGTQPVDASGAGALGHLSSPPVRKPVALRLLTRAESDAALSPGGARLTLIANGRNEGFAVGNNVALRWLLARERSGYACLINNDMVVAPDAVRRMVERLESDAGIAAVGGVVLDYFKPDIVQMVGGASMSPLGMTRVFGAGLRREDVPATVPLDFVGGGCLLIRIETLRHVGLLDERFFLYGEDCDWGIRMRRNGYRLEYARDSLVWHKGGQTTGNASPFQDYHLVRATLQYVRKHSPVLALPAFAYSLYRSLAPKIVRRQWTRARAVLNAYADFARS